MPAHRFVPAPADREYPKPPTLTISELNQFFFLFADPDPRKTTSDSWIKPGKYSIRDRYVTGKFEFEATGKTEVKFSFSFIGPEFPIPPLAGVALKELEWASMYESKEAESSDKTSGEKRLQARLTEEGDFIYHPGRGFIVTSNTNFLELDPVSCPDIRGAIRFYTRGDMVFSMTAPVRGYIVFASGLEGFEHVRTESGT